MRQALALVVVVAASAYVIIYRLGEGEPGWLAGDIYNYFYPHMLHTLRSLAAGGRGLLWNPFQSCGQPFFATTGTALLNVPNLLFLVLDPQTALRGLLFINLVIGGLGAYGLARELGVSLLGALGAALAFVLGNSAYHLTTWEPTIQTPFVWMPAAMWCCERLVKRPSLRQALVLGMVLGVSLLPGHPQFVLFTCQLIGLRLLWTLLDGSERRQLPRAIGGVAMAFMVMVLLAAVQVFPGLEVAAESVRNTALVANEIAPQGVDKWADVATRIHGHNTMAPFSIVPGFIVPVALLSSGRRRLALFYVLAGALFLALSLGDNTMVGRTYLAMPLGHLFRHPFRFVFPAGFCVSVLAGLAIDELAGGSWRALAVAGAALAGLYAWLGSIWAIDWWLAGAVLGGGLLAVAAPTTRLLGAPVIAGTVGLALVVAPPSRIMRFLTDDGPLRVHAEVFERLHGRLTPQDRVYLVRKTSEAGFEEKTATLFALRSITDYEGQVTRRYAQYLTMLQNGALLRSLNQVLFPAAWNRESVRWPLVDLAAARYVIIDKSFEEHLDPTGPLPLIPVDGDSDIRVFENTRALPRAYYVPQIAVMPDAAARLRGLAAGIDARRLAFVDAAPASGFLGVAGNRATADGRFVVDDPERVVLEAVAPERGFLFLADQYFPGWFATVNEQPAPIMVANHTFRLVETPKGQVRVEFRYRPRRVWIGALISGVTLLVVAGLLVSTFRAPSTS